MFRAEYLNGKLIDEPAPVAGNQGTTITVEDLFYNVQTRLKGLSNYSEEYGQVLKIMQRYAIQLAGRVGLSCRKSGLNSSSDLQTSISLTPSPRDVIKLVFGPSFAKGISQLQAETLEDVNLQLSGYVSLPTFHQKSFTLVLFINGRLVESPTIKKTVLTLYGQLLPKGTFPFAYLSLNMPPQNVDVNVHPTKSEVFFLHETRILEHIDASIRATITSMNLETQTIAMASASQPVQERITSTFSSQRSEDSTQPSQPVHQTPPNRPMVEKKYPFQLVHSDPKTRTLDHFMVRAPKITRIEPADEEDVDFSLSLPGPSRSIETQPIKETRSQMQIVEKSDLVESASTEVDEDPRSLTSVKHIIKCIKQNTHDRLTETIKSSVFIGLFDKDRALIQYQSQLLMMEFEQFARELFYQKIFIGFGFLDCWRLDPPLDLHGVLGKDMAVLEEQAEMLLAYFSIQIVDGKLRSLPLLIDGLEQPDEGLLSDFLSGLEKTINWADEQECFDQIAALQATFFASMCTKQPRHEEFVRHFLYPALKGIDMSKFGQIIGYSQDLITGTPTAPIIELTSTHELYKIFERC